MRLLWTALSVVAIANLLALIGFVGWLKATQRLDSARVTEVRQLLRETIPAKKAREAEDQKKLDEAKKEEEAKAHAQLPPVTASDTLALKLQQSQADQARLESIRRDVQIMQDTLKRERASLDAGWAQLKKEREDFEAARKQIADTEGDAQFKKTLATLQALKPDKARLALQQLIAANNVPQAVSYLNAMQERTRTKIIDEFLTDDPKLAADLLERLRTRGLTAAAP
jgi:hypothetical protein